MRLLPFFADTDGFNIADHVYSAVCVHDARDLYKPFLNKKAADENLQEWIPLDSTCEDLDSAFLLLKT